MSDDTVNQIMALVGDVMSECHQTGYAEPGSLYADITGPKQEEKALATLRAAVERVVQENASFRRSIQDVWERAERAEAEAKKEAWLRAGAENAWDALVAHANYTNGKLEQAEAEAERLKGSLNGTPDAA